MKAALSGIQTCLCRVGFILSLGVTVCGDLLSQPIKGVTFFAQTTDGNVVLSVWFESESANWESLNYCWSIANISGEEIVCECPANRAPIFVSVVDAAGVVLERSMDTSHRRQLNFLGGSGWMPQVGTVNLRAGEIWSKRVVLAKEFAEPRFGSARLTTVWDPKLTHHMEPGLSTVLSFPDTPRAISPPVHSEFLPLRDDLITLGKIAKGTYSEEAAARMRSSLDSAFVSDSLISGNGTRFPVKWTMWLILILALIVGSMAAWTQWRSKRG